MAAMSNKTQLTLGLVVGCAVAGLVVAGLLLWGRGSSPIPKSISKKAAFSIFYPQPEPQAATLTLQPKTIAYDSASNGLSYTVLVDGKKIVVTEQATPDVFSQNGVYDFKLNQAHQYDSFSTSAGQVTLTKPTEANGQTVAWVNARGTLTLAHALQDLTEAEWKQLFNSMTVQ